MAKLMHDHQIHGYKDFPSMTVQSVNFIFGLILFAVALFFMFSREAFMRPLYQVDGFLLIFSGVVSIAAAMSKKVKTVFWINLFLGILLLLGSMVIRGLYGHTGEDFIVHVFIGLVFLYNASSCRRGL